MRRRVTAGVAVAVAMSLTGCGSDDDAPAEAAFPTTAAVRGDDLSGSVEDPAGDAGDPVVDLRRATIEQRGTTLVVRVVLGASLPATTREAGPVQLGAYLLRDPDDTEPFAARMLLQGTRPPAFRWGPWLERGAPAAGTAKGAEVSITVRGVPAGRYRYVQFFAESDRGTDIAPDDAPDGAGVVAIEPVGP